MENKIVKSLVLVALGWVFFTISIMVVKVEALSFSFAVVAIVLFVWSLYYSTTGIIKEYKIKKELSKQKKEFKTYLDEYEENL